MNTKNTVKRQKQQKQSKMTTTIGNLNGGCSIVRRFDSPKVHGLGLGLGLALEMYLVGQSD